MEVTGDTGAAVDFLRWVRPAGPWVLTAIPPERGGRTTTETFDGSEVAELRRWLDRFNGHQNLYFMVNLARGPMSKKASKEDVSELVFLHVDIDPAKGKEIEVERAAIIERLRAFAPAPSAIIDSGGGFQGFWRLERALFVGGDPVRAADAEAYNQQLELLLGGDNCFNVDRIMRIPGTVNLPNEKKQAVGRVPALARAVELTELSYPLGEFTAAPRAQAPVTAGVSGPARVSISGNLAPVLIDDLPERVTPRTRMLIVLGEDPDDPTRYGSRSAVVWAVVCEMVRAGCSDDVIASVILDPDYGVSAHMLAQRRPLEYAGRQIQRAREDCEEPMLRVLNERHAVIADLGGKCRIISEVVDNTLDPPRSRISKQSFEDFRNRYMHIKVQVGTDKEGKAVYKKAGAWWLEHPMRRQYTSLVFSPEREVEDAYNLWQGFACEAIPGRLHEPYLEHLRENVCGGNEEHYAYLIRWMAYCVHHPGRAGQVAIVLKGGMGIGKGTLAHLFGSLWGRHYMQVTAAKHLVGQFNAHLRDCVVLFADEAFFAGDKQHEGTLRGLVTEPTLVVEGKGVDAEIAPNFTHIIMGSNSQWVIPAGADERRFLVLLVSEGRKQDSAYFAAITDAWTRGGRESFLHYMMTLDLTGFNVRDVPKTEALREQKIMSLGLEEAWWLERLTDGRITAATPGWREDITKDAIQADYLRYAESQRQFRRVSPIALGRFLARVLPEGYPRSTQRMTDVERTDERGTTYFNRERAYWYTVPGLEEARAHWDKKFGGPFDWPSEEPDEGASGGTMPDGRPY